MVPFHGDPKLAAILRALTCPLAAVCEKNCGNVVESRSGMGLTAIINIEAYLSSKLPQMHIEHLLNRLDVNEL